MKRVRRYDMTTQTSQYPREREVEIPAGSRRLYGILNVPRNARGVVVFAHGSGSGRFSPRNQFVAGALQEGGLATLLVDLLEEAESEDRDKVFDIELLAQRLQCAADWLCEEKATAALRLGYFGVSAVRAPTRLIVGGDDDVVLQLNEQALRLLRCPKDLVVIPGATHLFPEPGALEEVARLAREWFVRHLDASRPDNAPGRC
jgi:putative phosphoribosyl transferase